MCLTNPLAQSLLLRVASVGAGREKTFVKQGKREFYLGCAVVNGVFGLWRVWELQRDLLVRISHCLSNMAKDTLKTCKHAHIHIEQTASVGRARCWRHIRFIVETWRPACSGSVTQTDGSGPSTSQAPLLLAHCCYRIC